MSSKLFVAGLAFALTDQELNEVFNQYGEVLSAKIIRDRETGKSKGYGFVEMGDQESALRATSSLNGAEILGRAISVSEAKPQEARPDRPRGGAGGGGFNRGGNGGGGGFNRGGNGGGGRRDGNGGGGRDRDNNRGSRY